MDFPEAAAWILAHTNHEVVSLDTAPAERMGLLALRALLTRLGDPQNGRGAVHITGSNGKGSTAAMIAALLQGCGERTGLYTSPHLHTIRERIQVNHTPIDEAAFARLTGEIRPHAEALAQQGTRLTVFELLTALGFLHFRETGVTWQVVEVGLGGTLDATNVLDEKQVCVFTPIDLEHTRILGNTVAQIAGDKAGILRRGVRAVMGLQRDSAAEALREACAHLDVPLAETATDCALARDHASLDQQELRIRTPRATYHVKLPLLGRFQAENAATALLAVEQLAETVPGVALTPAIAAQALGAVRWPGRLEVLRRSPLVVVDGAHTPDAAKRLVRAVRGDLGVRAVRLVIGTSADKDLGVLARAFEPLQPEVIAVASAHPRAASAADVARAFMALDLPTRQAPSVAEGMDAAIEESRPDALVLATGSLFVVAEARAAVLGLLPSPA